MIELGKYQTLKVVRKSTIGVYLGDEREQVLLPKKQVPQDISVGDSIKVFIYRDSEDRLISTVNQPLLTLGEVAMLTVKSETSASTDSAPPRSSQILSRDCPHTGEDIPNR